MVRHGQTYWNAQGRWQGWLDSDLTELGIKQARAASEQLSGMHFDAAFSSDSGRALETARIIAEPHRLEIHPAEELRERFYGDYEGLNTDEIEARFPGTRYAPERDTRDAWRPPGGESLIEAAQRVHAFLMELARKFASKRVLLVAHSGVVRVLDSISSGQKLEDIWLRTPTNACVFIVRGNTAGDLQVVRHFCEPTAGE